MDTQRHLLDWLKDAHAMEKQAVAILDKQARRLGEYPDLQARIRQHIQETRSQADRIEACIIRLDGRASSMKDAAGRLIGNITALTTAMAEDEVVKNAIADFAFENMEIASYKCLIAAAESVGDDQTAQVCRDILTEEMDMASWLDANLRHVIESFLHHESTETQF